MIHQTRDVERCTSINAPIDISARVQQQIADFWQIARGRHVQQRRVVDIVARPVDPRHSSRIEKHTSAGSSRLCALWVAVHVVPYYFVQGSGRRTVAFSNSIFS